ncbi:MAG: hypothetical protein SXG53_22950 [Pseudomonadota bacterium]|nr:hypothetical protein [Pseudomonadota bacterium]
MPSLQTSIRTAELPSSALLRKYRHAGAYTDCYYVEVPGSSSLPRYVEAFYTTTVFKLERWLLTRFVAKPSSDLDARRVAHAEADSFAAWSVEERAPDQLLMCDFVERTRSWFMVEPMQGGSTRLYFGTAVVPVRNRSGELALGAAYVSLMGFHKLYSRILLRAARSRLAS